MGGGRLREMVAHRVLTVCLKTLKLVSETFQMR